MTFTVNSYAAYDNHSPLRPLELTRRDLLPDDVLIKISYTGICHTDLHVSHNDWKFAKYPIVPGHEIVGVVEAIGNEVTKHKVGDVVAVGCMVDSCCKCEYCLRGEEMFCKEVAQTYNFPERRFPGHFTAGGYSEKIVVHDHFAVQVPKELQTPELLPGVAPILCAGITMYSPMMQQGLKPGDKIAVVGLGGLGHMGVKIGTALGAEVTVISRSHKKDADAKELGAKDVIASASAEEMAANAERFDLVIDTIPFDHDINVYVPLAKPNGTISIVGHLGEFTTPFDSVPLVMGNRKLSGSIIGGIKETEDLFQLCAKHKIIARSKLIEMGDVNKAWQALIDGDSESRYVIDINKYTRDNQKQ